MTCEHRLSVPSGDIHLHYEWHCEMQDKRPGEKARRFRSISTVIMVPISLTPPQTVSVYVNGDWCSPLMVKQLARMYLKGIEYATTKEANQDDVRVVLKELETT